VQVLAATQIFGASWGDDDRIVFALSEGGLLEIPSAGGSAVDLTTTNGARGEVSHRLPHVLPGAVAVTKQPTLTFGTPRQLFVGRYSMNGPARGYV
jgi:hypothetical protein